MQGLPSIFNPSRHLILSFIIILFFFSRSLTLFLFFTFYSSLSLSLSLSLSPFSIYCYKRDFDCFNLPPSLSAPTSLGTLRTTDFVRMTWALRCIWSLWVALRRPTFIGSWNGGISQAWSIVAARTTMYFSWALMLLLLLHLSYLKAI